MEFKEAVQQIVTLVNEALEITEEPINIEKLDKDSLAKLIPTLEEFEIEFYGQCTDEVGGTIDYEYGGLKDTHVETEEDTGYITLEHPFIRETKTFDENTWEISVSWSTEYFDVHEKTIVNSVEEVYDFIISASEYFDAFELQTIRR